VLRDAAAGLEVLLLRRADRPGDQNSGAAVFPGGLLDAGDREQAAHVDGLDVAAASQRLDLPRHGLAYWVTAVRECFEEAGLLFATGASGQLADLRHVVADALFALRRSLHAGDTGFVQICEQLGLPLAAGELAHHSHWVTPLGMPKIFDTRFFVARAPAHQQATPDGSETVELLWLTPAQALDPARGLKLMNVTERTLRQLADFEKVDDAIAAARVATYVPMTRPRLA